MNRIFHARIAAGQYLFVALAGVIAVYGLWEKQILIAVLFMLLLVVSIEKLIHTTYTVTADNKLLLFFGRFSRGKEILLKDITSVERASSMQIGGFAVMRYVLVRYGEGKCAALLPVKEEEFIRLLEQRMSQQDDNYVRHYAFFSEFLVVSCMQKSINVRTMKYQVAIIGGGPAGYTAAETAGKAGLSVVLFEKRNLGGVCLNEGCIPTKTLLYSAKTYDNACHASKYAVSVSEVSFDLSKIIARKQKVVRKLVLGVKGKLTAGNVTIVTGEASVIDKNHVLCGDETYECDNLLLCTGSETFIPPIPGVDTVPYWTHRDALDNKELPKSLAIIGGGVIGMEFASFFNSLGVEVTVIEMLDEILGGMDKELSAMLRAEYAKRGIKFMLYTKVVALSEVASGNGDTQQIQVNYENAEGAGCVIAERLLMSVGRRPVTKGFGLENLNLDKTARGNIQVDGQMQTSVPGVYVCGDLTGFSLLAHTAVREAEVAVHAVLGKKDCMSYRAIPSVVYTNPEIAGVGDTEEALQRKGIPYRAVKLPMAYSGRFVAENEGINGMCKLLLAEDNTVLGAHVLGNPASEIITLAGMAVELKLTASEWKKMVFPHPTVGEIFKEAL